MYNKKILIFILFLSFFINAKTQHFAFDWVSQIGGDGWDLATDMVIDNNNNLYITGGFTGTAYFGNDSISSINKRDIFIAKTDSTGNLLWIKSINGKGYDNPSSITFSQNEDLLFISGSFSDNIIFNSDTINAKGYIDNFIIKLNKNTGNIINYKHITTQCQANKNFIFSDNLNNIYFAGSFFNKAIFGLDTILSVGNSDNFIIKYDDNLNILDYFVFGGNGKDKLNDIEFVNNSFYLTANFEESIQINDTNYFSYGKKDIITANIDTNWNYKWTSHAAGFLNDISTSIEIDKDYNTFITGHFKNKIYFGLTDSLTTNGMFDMFIVKYDSLGKHIWTDNLGSSSNDYGYELLLNNYNNIYVTGTFRDSVFKNGQIIKSKDRINDMFIAKYNNNGNFLWISQSGGNSRDYCNTILTDSSNYLYIIGNFDNNFAFETDTVVADSISNANPEDFFIARFYDCDLAQKLTFSPNDTIFCDYGQLKAKDNFNFYKWNTGKARKKITIYDSDFYWVQAVEKHNCLVRSDSIFIDVSISPQIELGPDKYVQNGQIIELFGGVFESYLWNTGDTTEIIAVLSDTLQIGENIYSLTAFNNQNNCSSTDDIAIYLENPDYLPPPKNNNTLIRDNFFDYNNISFSDIQNTNKKANNEKTNYIEKNNQIVKTNTLVYPNPNNGNFKISLNNIYLSNDAYIEIITEDGKILNKEKINKKIIEKSINNKGVFILNIYSCGKKYTEKIIIN